MILDDSEIAALVAEPKEPLGLADLMPADARRGHTRAARQVSGEDGSNFIVMVRQNVRSPNDFSVILGYQPIGLNRVFRLRRHNGPSHLHRNDLEGTTVSGCHIHTATERYQLAGFKEEGYAEPTDEFADLGGAIEHMLDAANFEPPAQTSIFRS